MTTNKNPYSSSQPHHITTPSTIVPHLSSHLYRPSQLWRISGRAERVDRAALLLADLSNQICDDFGYVAPGKKRLEQIGGKRYAGLLQELSELKLLEINHRYCFRAAGSNTAFTPFRKKYKVIDSAGEQELRRISSKAGQTILRSLLDESRQSAASGKLEQQTLENLRRLTLPADFQPETTHEATMASQFMSGRFLGTVTRCDYGRLHSPLTRTERRIRSLLRLEGKADSLVEVDVSCCQPLLLAIMSGDQQMIESCGDRSFYDEIESSLTQPQMQVRAKECFLWWMFRNRDAASRRYCDDISSLMSLKYPKTLKTWSMYNGDHLAHLLQCRESMLMIDRVLNSLFERGIFAVSVHDSFLVRPEDRDVVVSQIADAFPPIQLSVTTTTDQTKLRQRVQGMNRLCVA